MKGLHARQLRGVRAALAVAALGALVAACGGGAAVEPNLIICATTGGAALGMGFS